MAYTINNYNGSIFTVVQDGTVNQSTELKLVGKNFAGYGEAQNENFLHLLENFANLLPPPKPVNGMIWFDASVNKIKFYDGDRWRSTSGAEVSQIAPGLSVAGDFWWKSDTNQLYAKNESNDWILIGPQATEFGTTELISRIVLDVDEDEHAIIEAVIPKSEQDPLAPPEENLSTVFVISDSEFVLNAVNPINGFDVIKRGVTLIHTRQDTDGVTTPPTGETSPVYWGTASNSLLLDGRSAADFLPSNNFNFGGDVLIDSTIRIYNTNTTDGVIENVLGPTLIFNVTENNQPQTILIINENGLIPGTNNVYDIGTPELRWETIYATNFDGTAERSNLLRLGTQYVDARVDAVPNTIAARDNNANLRANLFEGTATTARYADLAEKYTTEQEWPVGTAMTVCKHSDHESCPAKLSDIAIGVISANPAYLMNSELENGQAIALKGRVPVRVIGPVEKGQAIYAWENGLCSTIATTALVGVALETNNSNDEKLIECVLKV
jgi:hypothetical protein